MRAPGHASTGPAPGHAASTDGGGRALRRWAALALVGAVLVGAGAVDRAAHRGPGGQAAVPVAARMAPSDAESSSWYCVGGGAGWGPAVATLYLTNASTTAATGTLAVVNAAGVRRSAPVTVGPQSQVALDPGTVVRGYWAAAQVDLSTGGVVVTQAVRGATGWSEAPCASTTRGIWYFPAGSTAAGTHLFVSLYNPTSTAAVADLSFVTAAGLTQPAPFQGIVLPPGRVTVQEVGTYVQDQKAVATIVHVGSGRLVAGQLELVDAGVKGESLELGSPAPEGRWSFPRSADVTGGSTTFSIFNPSSNPQRVTVRARIPSGALAPFTNVVAADSTWVLDTSRVTRIPHDIGFSLTVQDDSPEGVVVGRTEQSAPKGAVPQVGTAGAVPASVSGDPSSEWLFPSPGAGTAGAVPGAAPYSIDLQNGGAVPVDVQVGFLSGHGLVPLTGIGTVRLAPGTFVVLPKPLLAPAGLHALVVTASGPLAAVEDVVPVGVAGVVAMTGIG